jgi:hypothetical protein
VRALIPFHTVTGVFFDELSEATQRLLTRADRRLLASAAKALERELDPARRQALLSKLVFTIPDKMKQTEDISTFQARAEMERAEMEKNG